MSCFDCGACPACLLVPARTVHAASPWLLAVRRGQLAEPSSSSCCCVRHLRPDPKGSLNPTCGMCVRRWCSCRAAVRRGNIAAVMCRRWKFLSNVRDSTVSAPPLNRCCRLQTKTNCNRGPTYALLSVWGSGVLRDRKGSLRVEDQTRECRVCPTASQRKNSRARASIRAAESRDVHIRCTLPSICRPWMHYCLLVPC